MSQDNFNVAHCGSAESRRLSASEEAEILESWKPQRRVHELDIKCRTYKEYNFKLQSQVKILQQSLKVMRAEKTMLQESVSENTEIKKELTQVLNLLSKEKSFRDKNDTYIRKLEEKLGLNEENENMTAGLLQFKSLSDTQKTEIENLKAAVQDLEENERILRDNLTAEHDRLKSLREEKHTEVEQLRAELQSLQDNEMILNEQNKNLTADMAQLECFNVKKHAEVKQLRAELQSLQDNEMILNGQNKNLTANMAQLEWFNAKNQAEVKQLRATAFDSEHCAEEAQQDHSDEDELLQKVVRLQTENKNLLAAVQDLQANEKILRDNLTAERDHMKSLKEKKHAEVEQLRAQLQSLQDNEMVLNEQNKNLTADMAQLECFNAKKHAEVKQLRADLQSLQDNEMVLNEQNKNLTADMAQLECFNAKKHAEVEQLRADLQSLQDNEMVLNEQNKNLTANVAQLQCLYAKNQAEIEQLRTTAYDLEQCATEPQQDCSVENELLQKVAALQTENESLLAAVQDLREKKKLLRDNLTAEHDRLKSLKEEKLAEAEQLRAEWQSLQDNEMVLNEQNKNLTSDMAQLECFNAKKHAEVEQLRAELQSLQDNEMILNEQNKNLSANVAQLECLYVKNQAEIQKLKATVYDLEQCAEEVQQNHSAEDELLQKVAKLQTENKNLLAAVQDLQVRETSLYEQNKNICAELALAESLIEKKQAENRYLWSEVNDLQENVKILNEKTESLMAEVAHHESLREKKQGEIESLRAAVCELQCQVREAQEVNRDVDEVMQKLTHVESLMEKKQAEIKQLGLALHDLQEKEGFLNKQNESMADELARLEPLAEKLNEKNKNLKITVQDLQCQLEEAKILIWNKDELIRKQERETAYKQELIEELYISTTDMKQSIHELKELIETRQEENILGDVNFREESRNAENTEQLDSPEEQTHESLLVPTGSLWRRYTKGLLKVGLHIGITTAGLFIPVGILASQVTANCNTVHNCCPSDCAYQLLEPYYNFLQTVPHPF
ncbi:putative leucine-rich repeat-containing protein DDB_G0290503 [Morone saxatilis]|uniref:putative leucine-rich repeat-containing protein DDB_G0290503 n=1 Tax=Morone saxatilis TaxID=34816 RepID=UPI0015E24819|nr:putative leucine-rich repeat-containing protein DDB_G0290503 [Morone saxatilis]